MQAGSIGAECAAAPTADSSVCDTASQGAPRLATKNSDQDPALKSNPGIRSWNRIANRPPKELLDDLDVRRWHDNLRRSSNLTCTVRLRRLNLFCDRVEMTPHEMARAGRDDPMKAENTLLDHVSWMEEKKYASGYITGMVCAVKSWLDYNHIEIRRKIKVANSDVPVTIQDEKVPDKAQLKKMLDAADPRCRAIISMMAFAGVSPQVMGLADKSDCLGAAVTVPTHTLSRTAAVLQLDGSRICNYALGHVVQLAVPAHDQSVWYVLFVVLKSSE